MTSAENRRHHSLTSTDGIRTFIETILPDEAMRRRALLLFADSMEYIHALGASKWGAYCYADSRDRIRLLCCGFIVLTVNGDGLWLSLDQEILDSSASIRDAVFALKGLRADNGESPGGYPRYVRVASRNVYYSLSEADASEWPLVRDLHFAFLDRVANRQGDLPTSSQRKHQPGLIACLREILKRDLPDPVYPGGGERADISEVGSWTETGQGLTSYVGMAASQLEERGEFDAANTKDARQRVVASIVRRQGQPAFRRKLLEAYSGACAFSGCSVTEILEAAHIVPYRGPVTNHAQNGLLLRADLHTLFDIFLMAVDTTNMTVLVAPGLMATEYAALHGAQVRTPVDPTLKPSVSALNEHRQVFDTEHTNAQRKRPPGLTPTRTQ